jgi:toxin FitB
MSYLVDTNVLSELAKPLPADGVLAWFHANQSHLYVSSVTIGEIRKGLELMPAGRRKESLKVWFKTICETMEGRILSFNTATARVWGQMVGTLEKKGIQLPTIDSQLAATAQRNGLTMVTRNVADFQNTGVKLLNPFSA